VAKSFQGIDGRRDSREPGSECAIGEGEGATITCTVVGIGKWLADAQSHGLPPRPCPSYQQAGRLRHPRFNTSACPTAGHIA